MQNFSDRNGRALEYIVVKELEQQIGATEISFTARTLQAQLKDQQKYISLPIEKQQRYKKCAERIYQWLKESFSTTHKRILIDRLSDQDARRQSDPTDIRITAGLEQINLSIKHNHTALKHQRPGSTAQHCGYPSRTPEDIQFRASYGEIAKRFYATAQGHNNFRDLEVGIVFRHLYIPVCELVAGSINHWATASESCNHLFTFLVGATSFYKIIFSESQSKVIIQAFSKPHSVESVIAQSTGSYINLDFSNSWKISMRLHTASSRITANPSLKFDTQLDSRTAIPQQEIII